MTVSMYKCSAPIFLQYLGGLSNVLDKAKAHVEAKKLDEAFFMNMRIYPDMFPFVRQVRSTCDHAVNACARIAGREVPTFANDEKTFDDLKKRVERAMDFVRTFKPEELDGQEAREIVVKFPSGERHFTGQTLLLNLSLPNFYFHDTTAYAILRHCGVEIGKRDFMGVPVQS